MLKFLLLSVLAVAMIGLMIPSAFASSDVNHSITITEYGDYQSQYSKKWFDETLKDDFKTFMEEYEVTYIFKNYTIIGEDSIIAAHATHCAKEQGKFWQYHDILFNNWAGENTGWISQQTLEKFAIEIGLNVDEFKKCNELASTSEGKIITTEKINLDNRNAMEMGFSGVPEFLISIEGYEPISITGAKKFEDFERIVKNYYQRIANDDSFFPQKEKSNLSLNDIRYDVLNPLVDVFDNIESDTKLESIISNTIERVSPEVFQELRPNHIDVRSSQFCGIVNSPTISTENKQVFLEMCQSLITLLKEKVSNSLDDVDDNLAIAERKIDQMDIPDTEKNRIKSELNDDVKIATQVFIDVGSKYLTPAQRILDDHNQIQDTRMELTGEGGGCLIATAAFGSEMAPQVQFLREIRDNTVMTTESGTTFMTGFNQFYYSFSPAVADYERENPVFKEAVKVTLTPLLTSLTLLNYVEIDSEEEMLGYGIGIILLNVGMYFVAPAVLIIALKNRLKN